MSQLTPQSMVTQRCLKVAERGYVEPYYEMKVAAILLAEDVVDLLEALIECCQSMDAAQNASFGCLTKAKAAIAKVAGGAE